MAKIEKKEDQGSLKLMKELREALKATGGKELLPDEDWLAGESTHIETEGAAESVDQFVIKKRRQK